MRRDPIVLADNCILDGSQIGITRPNGNALIVGTTGCGKTMSVLLPTLARLDHSNPIISFAKEREAFNAKLFLEFLGYEVDLLNIAHPESSTISFDPILSIEAIEDIDSLSSAVVHSVLKKTSDDYWNAKAKPLLSSLISYSFYTASSPQDTSMSRVFDLFDMTIPHESGLQITTDLTPEIGAFCQLGHFPLVTPYQEYESLPPKTASCVRDTLAGALHNVFPYSIRNAMQNCPQFDVESFTKSKRALLIITSAIDQSQAHYANLFYRMTIRQLLRHASRLPSGELPREVRFFFDDFACTSCIEGFDHDISLFRGAGISAILFLQSESQLEKMYSEEGAAIIRQNCSAYCYFPGGLDDRSAHIVSKRFERPFSEILSAPMGSVYVLQSGQKPIRTKRYDILHSREYQHFQDLLDARDAKRES